VALLRVWVNVPFAAVVVAARRIGTAPGWNFLISSIAIHLFAYAATTALSIL